MMRQRAHALRQAGRARGSGPQHGLDAAADGGGVEGEERAAECWCLMKKHAKQNRWQNNKWVMDLRISASEHGNRLRETETEAQDSWSKQNVSQHCEDVDCTAISIHATAAGLAAGGVPECASGRAVGHAQRVAHRGLAAVVQTGKPGHLL